MIEIKSAQTLNDIWTAPALVLFKHSTQCDLSAMAYQEVLEAVRRQPELQIHWVEVVESRPISQEIERRTGIRHESPQLLILKNGDVSWYASHRQITAKALLDRVAAAAA